MKIHSHQVRLGKPEQPANDFCQRLVISVRFVKIIDELSKKKKKIGGGEGKFAAPYKSVLYR